MESLLRAFGKMESLLRAFGWGTIRFLISALGGFGVGLLLVGQVYSSLPEGWPQDAPPPGLFEAIGHGLLAGAALLLLLFGLGWLFGKSPATNTSGLERVLRGGGTGFIKVLICGLVGGGAACVVIGPQVTSNPDLLHSLGSRGPFLFGTGVGLVAAAVMLLVLFVLPWLLRRPADTPPQETPQSV